MSRNITFQNVQDAVLRLLGDNPDYTELLRRADTLEQGAVGVGVMSAFFMDERKRTNKKLIGKLILFSSPLLIVTLIVLLLVSVLYGMFGNIAAINIVDLSAASGVWGSYADWSVFPDGIMFQPPLSSIISTETLNKLIISHFGIRTDPVTGIRGTMHNGIDFRAVTGTPVYAAMGGTIDKRGYDNSYGYYIVIAHPTQSDGNT